MMTRAEALREANDLLDEFGDKGVVTAPCWNCDPSRSYLRESLRVVFCARGCGRFYFKGVHIAGGQHASD